jgi:alpha-mannosidase
MSYDDLLTLIPSHSLEDFPTDLGETEAASLLNSFAVLWHPVLLANARVLPRWHRADDPPDATQRRLILVPTHCEGWLPSGWAERVASEGCVVLRHLSERQELVDQALAPLAPPAEVHPDVVADFLALGACHLQVELLTRKMRNFSSIDEAHLRREAVAAAEAAVAGQNDQARAALKECFDILLGARERFYPVDCYLLDLCLLIPKLGGTELQQALSSRQPLSLLLSGLDARDLVRDFPESAQQVASAVAEGWLGLVGGDLQEAPLPLLGLNSIVWQMEEAQRLFQQHLGAPARVWGRRRYGLFAQQPQLLKKAGFTGALHVVLDDGFYPDQEYTKFRWQGIEYSSIESLSRIPLAADAATSYLRFASRLAESMDQDHSAGVIFARWPDLQTPFFGDLQRMARYAPVLGKFETLDTFFEQTSTATRTGAYKPREYLTPFLFQAVAREEANPLSRLSEMVLRRRRLDRLLWIEGLNALLRGRSPGNDTLASLESQSESLREEAATEERTAIDTAIEAQSQVAAATLARKIASAPGDQPGFLVVNTLGFSRRVVVDLDSRGPRPIADGERVRIQWSGPHAQLLVEVPGAGFTWVPAEPESAPVPSTNSPRLAEDLLLQNELFEVQLNAQTGGIAKLKGHGRSPNRLSQQLNFRFARERTWEQTSGDSRETIRSHYGEMRLTSSTVTSAGPTLGEIVTRGEIVDQKSGDTLAGYEQTVRVWRGRPIIEMIVELTPRRDADNEPWHSYFASRFAWHDETAALSYAAQQGIHACADERIETPDCIEIATSDTRTTVLPCGLPFHRKTGPRMLDTILLTRGETQRRFRLAVAIDQDYPLQSALDVTVPAVVIPTTSGRPGGGESGWFFQVEPRNVQVLGMFPVCPPEVPPSDGAPRRVHGCRLRLVETEGRPARARLCGPWSPKSARQVDLRQQTLITLPVDGEGIWLDLTAYEVADVELLF